MSIILLLPAIRLNAGVIAPVNDTTLPGLREFRKMKYSEMLRRFGHNPEAKRTIEYYQKKTKRKKRLAIINGSLFAGTVMAFMIWASAEAGAEFIGLIFIFWIPPAAIFFLLLVYALLRLAHFSKKKLYKNWR